MSLQGQREIIAEALSTVAGIKASQYRPVAIGPGSAWPQVGELTRDDEVPDFLVTWRVIVVLPADERAASRFFDAQIEPLVDALEGEDVGYVSTITPSLMKSDGGDLQVMVLTMRREA